MLSATIYGQMSVQHLDGIQSGPPAGWLNGDSWPDWLKSVQTTLDRDFWPSKTRLTAPKQYPFARVEALTRADMAIMKLMQSEGNCAKASRSAALGAKKIASSNASIWECFDRENLWGNLAAWVENRHIVTKSVGLLASYQYAFPNGVFGLDAIDVDIPTREGQCMAKPVNDCVGSITELLKLEYQRPRPFQVAAGLGFSEFFHWVSLSANSPALPAGHELQAIFVFLCTARRFGLAERALNVREFAGWCAGIGDRRVYAGLHYPSDILASQFIAAQMIDCVFPAEETPYLREMFCLYLTHSTALRQMRAYDSTANGSSPFRASLLLLDESVSQHNNAFPLSR